jgi:hypothetical protein
MFNDDCQKTFADKDLTRLVQRKNRRRRMRRRTGRLPCRSALSASLFLPQGGRILTVWVIDLSTNGVGVVAAENIQVGEEVIITWNRPLATATRPLHARVLHCTAESDCCFAIGCQFKEPIDWALWECLLG